MDRRTFLKTTGAAAASAAVTAEAANAGSTGKAEASADLAAPALHAGIRTLRMVTEWGGDTPVLGDSSQRLARHIESATGGRYLISARDPHADFDGIGAIRRDEADLYHGSEHAHLGHHRAFAYFAGLPGSDGLAYEDLVTWLTIGGGQMLWDDLAAGFGVKPLLAGHSGASPGLCSKKPLRAVSDFDGLKVHVPGIGAKVVRILGGVSAALPHGAVASAFKSGAIDAAESLGAFCAMTGQWHESAPNVTSCSINANGSALSLGINRKIWDQMSSADQTIFEAVAALETRLIHAEISGHATLARNIMSQTDGVEFHRFNKELETALSDVSRHLAAQLAGEDAGSGRIADTLAAFRNSWAAPAAARPLG